MVFEDQGCEYCLLYLSWNFIVVGVVVIVGLVILVFLELVLCLGMCVLMEVEGYLCLFECEIGIMWFWYMSFCVMDVLVEYIVLLFDNLFVLQVVE